MLSGNKNDHTSLNLYQGRKFLGYIVYLHILYCGSRTCNLHKDGQDGFVDRIRIISQNQKVLNQEGSLVISSYNLR